MTRELSFQFSNTTAKWNVLVDTQPLLVLFIDVGAGEMECVGTWSLLNTNVQLNIYSEYSDIME